MPDEVAAKVEDTAGQAQLPLEIEVVDTPSSAPVTPEAPPAAPSLIMGKYKSLEDAEEGLKNLERTMHEKAQEAATYRKLLDERAAAPTPQFQQPQVDMDSQFRERLAENPAATIFEMTRFAAKQMIDEQQKTQRELVRRYQSFAGRPEYSDVAQEVAGQLPFLQEQPADPMEMAFLRAKLARLESGAVPAGSAARPVSVPFVEPANRAGRTGQGSNRIELDPDTAKLRGMGADKVRDLASIVFKQKNAGGTMREMSIDDWEKANA